MSCYWVAGQENEKKSHDSMIGLLNYFNALNWPVIQILRKKLALVAEINRALRGPTGVDARHRYQTLYEIANALM
jgi:hypothetical protein